MRTATISLRTRSSINVLSGLQRRYSSLSPKPSSCARNLFRCSTQSFCSCLFASSACLRSSLASGSMVCGLYGRSGPVESTAWASPMTGADREYEPPPTLNTRLRDRLSFGHRRAPMLNNFPLRRSRSAYIASCSSNGRWSLRSGSNNHGRLRSSNSSSHLVLTRDFRSEFSGTEHLCFPFCPVFVVVSWGRVAWNVRLRAVFAPGSSIVGIISFIIGLMLLKLHSIPNSDVVIHSCMGSTMNHLHCVQNTQSCSWSPWHHQMLTLA